MEKRKIVAISLFSGAGGLDVASFLAGVPVVSSTDFDSDCIKTLKSNDLYDDSEIIEGDLHQIESSVFSDILKKRDYDKFIVIGGAPCQPFSKAGYWVGNNTRKGINDPRATLPSITISNWSQTKNCVVSRALNLSPSSIYTSWRSRPFWMTTKLVRLETVSSCHLQV